MERKKRPTNIFFSCKKEENIDIKYMYIRTKGSPQKVPFMSFSKGYLGLKV